MTEHRYSIERLVHYRCCYCNMWWTIGDGPTAGELACPWCGHWTSLREMEEPGHD